MATSSNRPWEPLLVMYNAPQARKACKEAAKAAIRVKMIDMAKENLKWASYWGTFEEAVKTIIGVMAV